MLTRFSRYFPASREPVDVRRWRLTAACTSCFSTTQSGTLAARAGTLSAHSHGESLMRATRLFLFHSGQRSFGAASREIFVVAGALVCAFALTGTSCFGQDRAKSQ